MKTDTLIKIPDYKYNEYKLVLYPNEAVSEKIQNLKRELHQEYNLMQPYSFKPSLTLINFIHFEMIEERLITRLHSFAKKYRPFNVELNGFGSHPSHTIFINIQSKQTIQNLIKELRSLQRLVTLNLQNKPHFLKDPHFILAGKLLPWQYEKGWIKYNNQPFTSRFIAEEMTLLKKSLSSSSTANEETGRFQIAGIFKFENLPEMIGQGDLFK